MNKSIYLCPPLLAAFYAKKLVKILIGGRGTGKSTYIGVEIRQCAAEMPRSKGSLSGPTYNQILTKILPSAKKMLMKMGMVEDRPGQPGHFTIGKRPPAYFKRPYDEPEKWEYVISFFNGSAVELISMDRPDSARGGSYDYKLYDEAVLMPKKFHDNIDIMTLRGNLQYFKHCPRHGMRLYVSSQAHTSAGYWVEDQKYLRDQHGNIKMDDQGQPVLDPDVFCQVFSSWANIKVLGEKVLKTWKKTASPLAYDIEVMSKRGGKLPNGFYPAFEAKKHTYFGGYEYDYDDKSEFGIYTKMIDSERNTKAPLLLTFDFNAVQNSMIVAQDQGNSVLFMNEFYIDGRESEAEMLKPFIEFYKNHQEKYLYLYGDPGGNKPAIMEKKSTFEKIMDELEKHGWKCQNMVTGKAYPGHREKHQFINRMLKGNEEELPQICFHMTRCKWLTVSIENAPINPNFTKNKKSENQDIDQRTATHGSDAFDYLIYYRYHKRRPEKGISERVRVGNKSL